jgi:hypothetical protein
VVRRLGPAVAQCCLSTVGCLPGGELAGSHQVAHRDPISRLVSNTEVRWLAVSSRAENGDRIHPRNAVTRMTTNSAWSIRVAVAEILEVPPGPRVRPAVADQQQVIFGEEPRRNDHRTGCDRSVIAARPPLLTHRPAVPPMGASDPVPRLPGRRPRLRRCALASRRDTCRRMAPRGQCRPCIEVGRVSDRDVVLRFAARSASVPAGRRPRRPVMSTVERRRLARRSP